MITPIIATLFAITTIALSFYYLWFKLKVKAKPNEAKERIAYDLGEFLFWAILVCGILYFGLAFAKTILVALLTICSVALIASVYNKNVKLPAVIYNLGLGFIYFSAIYFPTSTLTSIIAIIVVLVATRKLKLHFK